MVKERLSRMGNVDYCTIVQPGTAHVTFRELPVAERVFNILQGSVLEGQQLVVAYD